MDNTRNHSTIDELLRSFNMKRSDLDIVLKIGTKNLGIRSFSIAWYIFNIIIAVLFYIWLFLVMGSIYVLNN